MKYSEFIKKLNVGMLVKGFKIVSAGSESEIEARAALLKSYTRVVRDSDGTLVGVVPISTQERDCLSVYWEVCEVKIVDRQIYRQGPYSGDMKFSFSPDEDLDVLLIPVEI